jgi:hypothetical protein
VWTGGTLAGEDVVGSSVLRPDKDESLADEQGRYGGADLLGERRVTDPALAGTVAGNTTAAGEVVRKQPPDEPTTLEEDLGPEGTVVQAIGGEARY